jgi:hypothetical protein
MVFDKLFGWVKKKDADPDIPFGRYSDNNKPVEKVNRWTDADNLFKEKKYAESMEAFFDYLCDESQQNVIKEKKGESTLFRLYQGSKLVRGEIDKEKVKAEVTMARMTDPATPVMRRLLEMNFNLYYSRYALKEDKIYMLFDTEIHNATPNKLYYGLKELATKADKQDDLLLSEFPSLAAIDTEHIDQMSTEEKEIRYEFLQKWIRTTLNYISTLDAEKFSGAISYLLLTLVFRIDYLVSPQGKVLSELEKIASAYYTKEDKSSPERNPSMIESFNRLAAKSREDIFAQLFRSRYTFAIVPPHNLKSVSEAIETALQNMVWYRDNNYPDIANKVMEYGFSFCQYSYSLPKPLTDLFRLFMQINYSDYFEALGYETQYYDEEKNEFNEDEIKERIDAVTGFWKLKYPSLSFKIKKLKFDTLVNFNQSYLQETALLNFE